ncbi:MAG TPA: hypothetical protein VF148_12855 [Acidimicrobiia bacterium]
MTRLGNASEAHTPRMGGVFGDRSEAEAAVEDLRRSGLADEHLGVAMHEPGDIVFEEDVEAEMTHKLEMGVAVGAPVGAIAGMTLLALIVPGLGSLGVGGILPAGAATGAQAGGVWEGYLGLKSEDATAEDMWDWERIRLREGEVMVVVDQHGHPDDAQRILRRHGGRPVTKPVS